MAEPGRLRGRGSSLSSSTLTPEEIEAAANALLAEAQGEATPTAANQAGFLRNAWDIGTGPLRALAGVTGTPSAQLLRMVMPEKYAKAARELEAIEKDKAGLDLFEAAAALPGAGDVLTADWDPESVGGRVGKTVTTLGANILGDPTSYVGVGVLPKLAKLLGGVRLGAAAKGLGGTRAMKAAARAEAVGAMGATGKAVAEGDAARAALTLPFSPLVGVSYAPELIEGVGAGVETAYEEAKAGRYAEAAASGAGAMLTAGLGALVSRGVIGEAKAAKVLKRALQPEADPQASVEDTTGGGRPAMPPPPPPGPSLATMQPFAPEGAGIPASALTDADGTPLESPAINPPAPQGVVAPPPAVVAPTPAQVDAVAATAPAAPPFSERATAILGLAEQGTLTRGQVLEALGLPWKRQKGAGDSIGDNLARQLGDEEAGRVMAELEAVAGKGYKRKVAATPVAPPTPPAAAQSQPVTASTAVDAVTTPTPVRAKGWVDAELAIPGNREAAVSALEIIAQKRGIELSQVTKADIAEEASEAMPIREGETPDAHTRRLKDYRAILYKVLPSEVKARAEVDPAASLLDEPGPSASLTRPPTSITPNLLAKARAEALANPPAKVADEDLPGEGAGEFRPGQPGTPPELRAREAVIQGGIAGEARKPEGIGPKVGDRQQPEQPILTRERYDQARAELAQMREMVADPNITDAARLELADEFAERDADLVELIQQAVRAGIHTQPMKAPAMKSREAPEVQGPLVAPEPRDIPAVREDRARVPAPEPSGRAVRAEDLADQERAARVDENTETEAVLQQRISDLREAMATGPGDRPNRGPGPRSGLGRALPIPSKPMSERARPFMAAILKRADEQGLSQDDIVDRARDVFGVDELTDLSPENLSILFSAMDRRDLLTYQETRAGKELSPLEERERIRQKTQGEDYKRLPTRIDPEIAEAAARTLTGGRSIEGLEYGVAPHIARAGEEKKAAKEVEVEEGRTGDRTRPPIQFQYDPKSPAGQVQAQMRNVHRGGLEDDLQETMLRWVKNLSWDDERHIRDADTRIRKYELDRDRQHTKAGELTEWGSINEAGDLAAMATYTDATLARVKEMREGGLKKFAGARNLRLLLTNPQALNLPVPKGSTLDDVVAKELGKLLDFEMHHRTSAYFAKDRKTGQPKGWGAAMRGPSPAELDEVAAARSAKDEGGDLEDLLAPAEGEEAVMRGGLTDEESARLSSQPIGIVTEVDASKTYEVDVPSRPANVQPLKWRETVANDPEMRQSVLESLYAIATAPKAKSGKSHPFKDELRQIEQDLGLKATQGDVERRAIVAAQAIRDAHHGGPSASSELLSHQVVKERGPQWSAAELKGEVIPGTNTRVVDLEGDIGKLTTKEVAATVSPLATRLAVAVADFANILGIRTRFGGITISPQLNGAHMDDAAGTIYVNHLHARLLAEAAVKGEGRLKGPAADKEISRRTAANIVDTLVHEMAHKQARHSDRVGDLSFAKAYDQYLTELGPHYGALIREVQAILPKTDQFMPRYEAALKEAFDVTRKGDVAGAGKGGAATGGDRPGGGTGGPDGGARGRVQPGRAVPGRDPAPGARAGEAAAADEGPFAGSARGPGEDGGGARGRGGVEEQQPSASLTTVFDDMRDGQRKRQTLETAHQIARRMAAAMGKFSSDPEAGRNYLRQLEGLKVASTEVREALATAGPQKTIDVGRNLSKYGADAMSDEQREQVGLILLARNHLMTRATPMTQADVEAAARRLFDTNTPEELVDMTKVRGLTNPADWAAMNAVEAIYMRQVDEATLGVRKAQLALETAKLTGKGVEAAEVVHENAMGLLGQANMRRDDALFTMIPESTQLARNLAFRRSLIHPLTADETFKSRFLGMLRSSGIKADKQDGFYRMYLDTLAGRAEPDEFARAFRQAIQPKWFDKFLEFWKAGLLGIPTQLVNITSNAAHLGLTNIEKSVSSLANVYFSGLTGAPRTRFISETAARGMGGKLGFGEAWTTLSEDLSNIARLQTPDPRRRMEMGTFYDEPNLQQYYGAIGGKWGEFVRIPFKLLDAFDGFFKNIIRNQEWAAQADRLAHDERFWSHGNEGSSHATARIYSELRALAHNPLAHHTLWMKKDPKSGAFVYRHAVKAGRDAAVKDTFQEALVGTPMREVAGAWHRSTTKVPALQLVTPFVKTPYNILAEALKRTPLGAAWAIKQWNAGKIDNPALVEAVIRSSIGVSIMALAFNHAMEGGVTGSGPADPKEQELLKRTGWQPRSIKVGDQYLSYSRFAPFSIMLGLAADMADAYKNKDVATGGEMFEKGVQSASANITDQSFLTGVDNLMKLLTDPKRQGATVVRQFQASLVPNIVGVVPFGHAARAIDPLYRETEALTMSPFMANTPFLSKTLQPQFSATGEPRQRPGTAGERLLSPINRTPVRTDPIATASAEIARVGPSIESTPLFYRVGTDKVYYSPDERAEIGKAQQRALERVAVLLRSAAYQRLPDTMDVATAGQKTKKQAIEEVLNQVRRPVVTRINKQALRRAQREPQPS